LLLSGWLPLKYVQGLSLVPRKAVLKASRALPWSPGRGSVVLDRYVPSPGFVLFCGVAVSLFLGIAWARVFGL